MASIYNSRKFNLVPPKSAEEENVIKERDSSFFYSFILIFCAVVVFGFLTLAQKLVVEPRIQQNKYNLQAMANEISTHDNLKKVHGELYIKSQSLDSILLQDIKLTQLLETSEQLIANIPTATIISYSREVSGQFVVDFQLTNFEEVSSIFDNSENIEFLENLNLREVVKVEATNTLSARFGFNITNIIN